MKMFNKFTVFSETKDIYLLTELSSYLYVLFFKEHYTFLAALQVESSRVGFPIVPLEFFIDVILLAHCDPGVDLTSHRNEYQKYFLRDAGQCVGLTTSPLSRVCFLVIW
jgi:hypothetical protein